MLVISKPIDSIIKAAGKQKVNNTNFRLLTYTITEKVDDGLLVYNLITKELVLLNDEEVVALQRFDLCNETIIYLINNWFIVPKENDDYLLNIQLDKIFRIVSQSGNIGPKKSFVIFPTTDCNARCFYCFELACKRIDMTEETAHDVAKFIIEKSKGEKKITLNWFGGEPLFNAKVIDIICNDLIENKIDFKSKMISNGYLFDEDMINKSSELWKLQMVQITLDGTESTYNRIKAYIYRNVDSPFKKVLNNIELLLKSNIHVAVRLNIDLNNCEDIKLLVEDLLSRFEKYQNINIYSHPLFEKTGEKFYPRSIEDKKLLAQKCDELDEMISRKGKKNHLYSERYRHGIQCMADNDRTTTILPDGKLGKCEHFIDSDFYGSIYSDVIDMDIINKFKERSVLGEQCNICKFLPQCTALKACPVRVPICDDFDKIRNEQVMKRAITNSYEYFKKHRTTIEDTNLEDC